VAMMNLLYCGNVDCVNLPFILYGNVLNVLNLHLLAKTS
jgi:hypothetical protein